MTKLPVWKLRAWKLMITLGVFLWNYCEGSLMKFKLGLQISPFVLVEKLHLVEWGTDVCKDIVVRSLI